MSWWCYPGTGCRVRWCRERRGYGSLVRTCLPCSYPVSLQANHLPSNQLLRRVGRLSHEKPSSHGPLGRAWDYGLCTLTTTSLGSDDGYTPTASFETPPLVCEPGSTLLGRPAAWKQGSRDQLCQRPLAELGVLVGRV